VRPREEVAEVRRARGGRDRGGDPWGFRVRGAGLPRVPPTHTSSLPQRFLLLQRKKWKPQVLHSLLPISEVAESENPVPASLT
jgi:hypothetical protein